MLNLIMGFIYEGLVGSGRRNPNLTKLCSCLYLSAADLFIILRAMKFWRRRGIGTYEESPIHASLYAKNDAEGPDIDCARGYLDKRSFQESA